MTDVFPRRFLKLDQVADLLATSLAQVYALVRRGELRAIKLGGRGQWRVETVEIDRYVEGLYEETRQWIEAHPFTDNSEEGPATQNEQMSEATVRTTLTNVRKLTSDQGSAEV